MALLQPSREHYRYITEGRRAVKTHIVPGRAGTMRRQVRYLPGLKLRLTTNTGGETTALRVAEVGNVRINRKADRRNTAGLQACFSLSDRTNSAVTELDRNGRIISREAYYPFGGTAVWTTKDQTTVAYKTRRYSGKERDTTGLYYYGYRYYAPWLMRWLNTDPAGTVDGLNLFVMVKNNPTGMVDVDGRMRRTVESKHEKNPVKESAPLLSSHSLNFTEMIPDWLFGAGSDYLAELSKKLDKTKISAKHSEEYRKDPLSMAPSSASVSDSFISKWAKEPLPDDNTGDFLYRGMAYDHPSIDKALGGIVEPANIAGTLSTKNHNRGQVSLSQYTSWTRNPEIAKKFATKNNKAHGIILRVKTGAPEKNESWSWVYSEDTYFEDEVLLKGRRITGVEVYTAKPLLHKEKVQLMQSARYAAGE